MKISDKLHIIIIVIFIVFLFGAKSNGPVGGPDPKLVRLKAQKDIRAIQNALVKFHDVNKNYLTTEEGLESFLKESSLIDPWGENYKYVYPGVRGKFDLYSLGEDKVQSDDDVGNWQLDE